MLEIQSLRILRLQAEQDMEVEANGKLGSRIRRSLAFALAGIGFIILLTLQKLSRQLFVDTADDSFALLWASIFGITPNPASASQGTVQATGAPGSVFAGGEVLTRDDGAQFAVVGPWEIGAVGEIELPVVALEAGAAGNTAAGATLTFSSPPAGVNGDALVINDGIVDGFDAETTDSVKQRTLALIRARRRGGSEGDYEIWAREITGIASAYARGSAFGIGTVLLIIAQEWDPTLPISPINTPIPSASLIAQVEAYIATQKPAGLHGVFIQPPVLQQLDPYIVLDPDTLDIQAAVTRSLALQLASVEPGALARYDDQVRAIDRAAGEQHHRLFVDNGGGMFGPYDTPVGDNNLLIPGTITWTEP